MPKSKSTPLQCYNAVVRAIADGISVRPKHLEAVRAAAGKSVDQLDVDLRVARAKLAMGMQAKPIRAIPPVSPFRARPFGH